VFELPVLDITALIVAGPSTVTVIAPPPALATSTDVTAPVSFDVLFVTVPLTPKGADTSEAVRSSLSAAAVSVVASNEPLVAYVLKIASIVLSAAKTGAVKALEATILAARSVLINLLVDFFNLLPPFLKSKFYPCRCFAPKQSYLCIGFELII
jgi:hypothetical protein